MLLRNKNKERKDWMDRKDLEPFLNKLVSFTYEDPIDGACYRKGLVIAISDSAITIEHNGQRQVYSFGGIIRLREVLQ